VIDSYWTLFLVGWAAAAALLGALYLHQRRTKDATLVDAGWAASLVLITAIYALLAPGAAVQRIVIVVGAAAEYGRLAVVVFRRAGRGEDSRYQELRARWRARGREQRTFAIFYQAQAALAALLSVPFLLIAFNPEHDLEPLGTFAVSLFTVAFLLELVADEQLRDFKSDPANRGKVMRSGLWAYSRHPNYFFQWLMWCAVALLALTAPHGWIALFAPALMLILILFVTGIPPAEQASLRSRGDEYRRYQQQTSAFVPWFHK
jgi:steroid 5-alpha reductase family enzyme